jgi:hypothetical protein
LPANTPTGAASVVMDDDLSLLHVAPALGSPCLSDPNP